MLKSSPVIVVFEVIVVSVPSKVEFELTYTLEPVTCKLAPVNAELDVIDVWYLLSYYLKKCEHWNLSH